MMDDVLVESKVIIGIIVVVVVVVVNEGDFVV